MNGVILIQWEERIRIDHLLKKDSTAIFFKTNKQIVFFSDTVWTLRFWKCPRHATNSPCTRSWQLAIGWLFGAIWRHFKRMAIVQRQIRRESMKIHSEWRRIHQRTLCSTIRMMQVTRRNHWRSDHCQSSGAVVKEHLDETLDLEHSLRPRAMENGFVYRWIGPRNVQSFNLFLYKRPLHATIYILYFAPPYPVNAHSSCCWWR